MTASRYQKTMNKVQINCQLVNSMRKNFNIQSTNFSEVLVQISNTKFNQNLMSSLGDRIGWMSSLCVYFMYLCTHSQTLCSKLFLQIPLFILQVHLQFISLLEGTTLLIRQPF